MNLSRAANSKSSSRAKAGRKEDKEKIPTLEQFVSERNYIGAITLLEVSFTLILLLFQHQFQNIIYYSIQFMSQTTKEVVTKDRGKEISIPIEIWLGYCHFHHGDYEKALKVSILFKRCPLPDYFLYSSIIKKPTQRIHPTNIYHLILHAATSF